MAFVAYRYLEVLLCWKFTKFSVVCPLVIAAWVLLTSNTVWCRHCRECHSMIIGLRFSQGDWLPCFSGGISFKEGESRYGGQFQILPLYVEIKCGSWEFRSHHLCFDLISTPLLIAQFLPIKSLFSLLLPYSSSCLHHYLSLSFSVLTPYHLVSSAGFYCFFFLSLSLFVICHLLLNVLFCHWTEISVSKWNWLESFPSIFHCTPPPSAIAHSHNHISIHV